MNFIIHFNVVNLGLKEKISFPPIYIKRDNVFKFRKLFSKKIRKYFVN